MFFTAALLNNVILLQLTGVSGLFAFSNTREQTVQLALLSFVTITLASLGNGLLDKFVLLALGLPGLRPILFSAVSSAIAVGLAIAIRSYLPLCWRKDQLAILLAGANSAVLGLALSNSQIANLSLVQLCAISIGSAAGFSGVLLIFGAMRERLHEAAIPEPFRGSAIQLITAGVLAMSLFALSGTL